jgi:hypothetical protein
MKKILLVALCAQSAVGATSIAPSIDFPKSNTVYVVGAALREFRGSPNQAVNAAAGGNMIIGGPGTFNSTNLLKASVNYEFLGNLTLRDPPTGDHGLFDDRLTGPTTNVIKLLDASWDLSDEFAGLMGLVTVTNPESRLTLTANQVQLNDPTSAISTDTDIAFLCVKNGTVLASVEEVTDTSGIGHTQAFYAEQGEIHFDFKKILMGHGRAIRINQFAGNKNLRTFIRGNVVNSYTGGPAIIIEGNGDNATNQLDIAEVRSNDGSSLGITGGVNFIHIRLMHGTASGTPLTISGGKNEIVIDDLHSQGTILVLISGGYNTVRVKRYRPWGLDGAIPIQVSGGTNLFEGGAMVVTNSTAMKFTGSHSTRLKDMFIQTVDTAGSPGNTNWCVQSLTNGLTLQNVTFQTSAAAVNCIWSSNALNRIALQGIASLNGGTTNSACVFTNAGILKSGTGISNL